MAKTGKIKVKVSGSFVQVFPETIVDQITDATTAGKNLLKLSNPAGDRFIKIASNGAITLRTMSEVIGDIGAATAVHGHTIANVTGLQTALDSKATLSDNKIQTANIPSWLFGGHTYHSTISTTATLDGTFRVAKGITSAQETWGRYFRVATASLILSWSDTDTIVNIPAGEGTPSGNSIALELGDMVVFTRHDGSKFVYEIINNSDQVASTTELGVGQISNKGSSTRRADLHNVSDGTKLIDEKLLRDVMRDVHYATSEPGNSLDGDILFQVDSL